MTKKIVSVFGASGLVGKHLLEFLLEDQDYSQVIAPSRVQLIKKHPILYNPQIDFQKISQHPELFEGVEVLFYCLGTTKKKAGGLRQFEQIERSLFENIILAAKTNKVKHVFIVSSIGANSHSSFSYPKIKGECELFAQSMMFESLYIFRPSLLSGERDEKRALEKMSLKMFKTFGFLENLIPQYTPVSAQHLAYVMHKLSKRPAKGINTFENIEIKSLF